MATNHTAEELKGYIFRALKDLEDEKITPEQANSISKLSDSAVQVVRTEIEYCKAINVTPNIETMRKSTGTAIKRVKHE